MKTKIPYLFIRTIGLVSIALVLLLQGCKKDEVVIAPQVTTATVTDVTFSSATLGGTIKSAGGGTILTKGICYGKATLPTILNDTTNQGAGSQSFVKVIKNLTPNTKYYARAYATNSAGVGYGEEFSFTTGAGLPSITVAVTSTTYTEILSNWTITSQGASSISLSGYVISTTNPLPVTGTDIFWTNNLPATTVNKTIADLAVGTKYFVRAFATNSQGAAYSNVVEATTKSLPTATDADGNTYGSVLIGTQVWMNKNLRTKKFSNGEVIPTTITPNQNIVAESNPIYYWAPQDNNANIPDYGLLYTSYVATDNRKVCPSGWHVPSNDELITLVNHLGGPSLSSTAGNKLKTAGLDFWANNLGTNASGFSAVGSGQRDPSGSYPVFKTNGELWSATALDALENRTLLIYSVVSYTDHYWRPKSTGLAIRCLKD
jgi:uncharacterized protein (TIGR02145 family)